MWELLCYCTVYCVTVYETYMKASPEHHYWTSPSFLPENEQRFSRHRRSQRNWQGNLQVNTFIIFIIVLCYW